MDVSPLYNSECKDASEKNVTGPEKSCPVPKLAKRKGPSRGRATGKTVGIALYTYQADLEASLSSASGKGTMPKEHRKHQFREKSEKSEIAATAQEIIQSPCSYFGRQREK